MFKILLALMFLTNVAYAEWDVNIPLAGDNLTDFPTDNQSNLDALEILLREYPKGMSLSYSSASTLVVSSGGVVCADSGGTTKKLRGNTSSTNVTFSDIDTGAEAANTTYYVYANCDASATTATFKISASSSAPSGVTSYKRLGSFLNDSSSNISATSIVNDAVVVGARNGDWSSKSIDSTYQATTDGFFVGYINCDDNKILTIKSDSSSSPSTVRQIVGCNSTTTSLYSGFSIPVRKGDYYVATASGTSDVYSATAFFLPNGT